MSAKDNLFLATQLRAVDVNYRCLNYNNIGRSPGLVAMGADLRSRGREFESLHGKLDGSFITFVCCKRGTVWG